MQQDSQSRPRQLGLADKTRPRYEVNKGTRQSREVFVQTIYVSLCSEEFLSLEKYFSVIQNLNSQGASVLGHPKRVETLGETQLPYSVFLDFVLSLGENKFR